eukprot:5417681-Alexandrium_andersonii.AAC.1
MEQWAPQQLTVRVFRHRDIEWLKEQESILGVGRQGRCKRFKVRRWEKHQWDAVGRSWRMK